MKAGIETKNYRSIEFHSVYFYKIIGLYVQYRTSIETHYYTPKDGPTKY